MPYAITDDVIRRAQLGEEEARREILQTFGPPVRVTVIRQLRVAAALGPYDVEDHLQEVWLKVFKNLGAFDLGRNVKFSTWLYTVVRNHCFDQQRRKQLKCTSLDQPCGGGGEGEWLQARESTERTVFLKEFGAALKRALLALPRELRRIFKLREIQGLEFHAIAEVLHLPVGTVKSRHYRAIDRLRGKLGEFRRAG